MRTRAFVVLSLVLISVVGLAVPSAGAQQAPAEPPAGASSERTEDEVVGASIAGPAEWLVEREGYTVDETYGFTLWKPEADSSHDHGGEPAVRVALAYGLTPGDIDRTIRARIAEFSPLRMFREQVSVGERRFKGVAVGPIPGSTPSTEVYVPVEGRVYQVNVYGDGERLSEEDKKLLSSLRFERPSRPVESLELPNGKAPESHYRKKDPELLEREREAREAAGAETSEEPSFGTLALSASEVPKYKERKIAEGCWRSASRFFFQTQHGMYANGSSDDGIPTGYTIIGRPNYWGQYTHGNLGYGRCKSTYYTNDKFAIDYPLNSGDVVFSPFKAGTVTFAGRNTSHKDYGIFVTIRADNGKYVNLSSHLSGLAAGIRPGAKVTDATIIGYAGDTGGPNIPVGEPHLHQAFYRYPRYTSDGAPYGGAGLQAIYHHYVGTAAGTGPGVYKFGTSHTSTQLTKGDRISN